MLMAEEANDSEDFPHEANSRDLEDRNGLTGEFVEEVPATSRNMDNEWKHELQSGASEMVDAMDESFPMKQVSIDSSDSDDDDDIALNMGLPYSDHNYDVPDPAKRYRKPVDEPVFPKLEGLTIGSRIEEDSVSQELRGFERDPRAQTRHLARSVPDYAGTTTGRVRNDIGNYSAQTPLKGFVPMRAELLPAFAAAAATSTYAATSPRRQNQPLSNNLAPSQQGQVKRFPLRQTPAILPSRNAGQHQRFSTVTPSPGSMTVGSDGPPMLQAAHRSEQHSHLRLLEHPSPLRQMTEHPVVRPTQPKVSYSSADPSQAALANAPAPTIIPSRGSIPLSRGRGGSQANRGKREEQSGHSDDGNSTAPLLRSTSSSPRKQVHFMDAVEESGAGLLEHERFGMSPAHSNHRTILATRSPPKQGMLPPHRMITMNTPAMNTPASTPRILQRPSSQYSRHLSTGSSIDAHPMPENIIEDNSILDLPKAPTPISRKSLSDEQLPPEVAAVAVELASGLDYPPSAKYDDMNEDGIKAKIATITKEIEEEQKRMEEENRRKNEKNSHSVNEESQIPRGRGRPKGAAVRQRNSNSGSQFGSPNISLLSPGSPPKMYFNASSPTRLTNRPPGSSPVRTNLDFNSHLTPTPAPQVFQKVGKMPTSSNSALGVLPIPTARPLILEKDTKEKRRMSSHGKKGRKSRVAISSASEDTDDDDQHYDRNNVIDDDDQDDVDEGSYTTRCICGYQHINVDMISCDKCSVWQHIECMGLNVDGNFKDMNYLCELCYQRPLKYTHKEARRIQQPNVLMEKKEKEKKGRKSETKSKVASIKLSSTPKVAASPKYSVILSSTYSKRARRLITVCLSKTTKLEVPANVHLFKRMFVAPQVEGLVSNVDIDQNTAIAELIGNVCMPDECGRDKDGEYEQHCVLYDGLADSLSSNLICIDCRKQGADARFVRRSCRPNSVLRHSVSGGSITFWIVSKERIPTGNEITIPFDCDYRQNMNKKDCTCHTASSDDECLLTFDPPAVPLGHKDTTVTECSKINGRGRPSMRPEAKTSNSITEDRRSVKTFKEEKSEEESFVVMQSPELAQDRKVDDWLHEADLEPEKKKRGRPSLPRKESEKEESHKEEPQSTRRGSMHPSSKTKRTSADSTPSGRVLRSPKKEVNEINYTLPSEVTSREQRKILMQVAIIDSKTPSSQKAEKKRGRPSTVAPKSSKREKSSKEEFADKEPKKEVKTEDSPLKEVRESTRKKKGNDLSSSASLTPASVLPPRRRWAAASEEQMRESGDDRSLSSATTPSAQYAGKKQLLQRYAASSEAKEDASVSADPRSVAAVPMKKRRSIRESGQSDDQKRVEAASVLAGMGNYRDGDDSAIRVEMMNSALSVISHFGIRRDFDISDISPTGVSHQESSPIKGAETQCKPAVRLLKHAPPSVKAVELSIIPPLVTKRANTPVPAPEPVVEEPPKKVAKRISIEDYKRRRPTNNTSSEDTSVPAAPSKKERGSFIPSMDNVNSNDPELQGLHDISLPDTSMIPTPSNQNVSIDDLSKSIFGEESRSPRTTGLRSPATPSNARSPRGDETDEEAPQMSLAERLLTEFGIGSPTSSREAPPSMVIPPVRQLAACPPPVSRRDSDTTAPSSYQSSSSRRSRF